MEPLIETRRVTKRYGGNTVLADLDFTLRAGESVALIGENGAGKSTFAKILNGVVRPDEGEIRIEGRDVAFASPRDALHAGLAFIPQELAYVPQLSVAENIVLGQWPNRAGVTGPRAIRARAAAEARRFGIPLDLDRRMAELKLAELQIVEIVKALARRARIIFLDEPTASLSEAESRTLFDILGQLTRQGVGVVYISHRMDEVYRFSDRVDVLRNGRRVASETTQETTPEQLIAHMLGAAKEDFVHMPAARLAGERPVASVRGWRREGLPPMRGVDFEVRRGEILGLYGLRGAGADLVAEGLAGLHPDIEGGFDFPAADGRPFASPVAARRGGVAYVPAERKRDGLVLVLAIRKNLTLLVLRALARLGVIRRTVERERAEALARRFDVRAASLEQEVGALSGGNQQKVLLASRLATDPRLLVLHEPTRGVDVGARVEIHRFLSEIAAQGCATILVTSDVEEAVVVSERLLIMRDGAIVGELSGDALTQANAVALATGSEAA